VDQCKCQWATSWNILYLSVLETFWDMPKQNTVSVCGRKALIAILIISQYHVIFLSLCSCLRRLNDRTFLKILFLSYSWSSLKLPLCIF
jgi:hypothetical protein